MKIAVSAYSFGHYANSEELGVVGVIAKAKEMGFDGIEFTDGNITYMTTALLAKAEAAKQGIEIVTFCIGADLLRAGEVEKVKAKVDLAAAMGAKMMRHDVVYNVTENGKKKLGISFDEILPRLVGPIREIADYAQSKGVRTLTENHGYFSQDANRVEKLINTVNHENFGALVDLGNFMCADEDPWKSAAIMAPYAYHVHVKDFHKKSGMEIDPGEGWFRTRAGDYLRGAIIGHGDAHIAQSLRTIKQSGYDGYLSIEFEGMEDNLKAIALGLANIKRFW